MVADTLRMRAGIKAAVAEREARAAALGARPSVDLGLAPFGDLGPLAYGVRAAQAPCARCGARDCPASLPAGAAAAPSDGEPVPETFRPP